MLLTFAIPEVNSNFASANEEERQRTLTLLTSGDSNLEVEKIERQLQQRRAFLDSIPDDAMWTLARLPLLPEDFGRLRTMREDGWIKVTEGTQMLLDATDSVRCQPSLDQRIANVISACKEGRLELRDVSPCSPRTMEGHSRLWKATPAFSHFTFAVSLLCPAHIVLKISKWSSVYQRWPGFGANTTCSRPAAKSSGRRLMLDC